MKKIYKFIFGVLFFNGIIGFGYSQSLNVPCQFYLDANNNCNYDAGETLLYNLPGTISLNYKNASAAFVNTSTTSICGDALTVNNPTVPAVNNLSYTISNYPFTYPTFSINTSCAAYTNLSYTTTNYLPVKSINQMSDFVFTGLSASQKNNTFPVCFNLGNDSVYFGFACDNIYSNCTSTTSTRTYSLYLDGILYDQITSNGGSVSGSKATVNETYFPWQTMFDVRSQLPNNISSFGTHTLTIKSTNLYGPSLSAINYSCYLNTVPCTKISGKFYNDCNFDCIKNVGDGIINKHVTAQAFGAGPNITFAPNLYGDFSLFLPNSTTNYYLTSNNSVVSTITTCPSGTITIPPGVTTNSVNLGFQAPIGISDPILMYGWPIAGWQNRPLPGGTFSIAVIVGEYLSYSDCSGLTNTNPGTVKLMLDKKFTYQNAVFPTPAPNNIISGSTCDTIIWNVADFSSNTFAYEIVTLVQPTVALWSNYAISAFIKGKYDLDLTNDSSNFSGTIGTSLDPNSKECFARGIQANGDIPFGVQDLYYTINFQNIGTAPAINVTTLDTLDSNLDYSSLQVLGSSFPVQTQVDNISGATFFYFKGIHLPDSTSNEPASHGYVNYKIKLKPNVPANTVIKNRAYNYFDFNLPVPTNQTKNKLVQFLGINEITLNDAVKIVPNPVEDKLNLSSPFEISVIKLYDCSGRELIRQRVDDTTIQLQLNELSDGLYIISLYHKNGEVITKKIIKK